MNARISRNLRIEDLTDADIAAVTDVTGLTPETAFDVLVMRRAGAYGLSYGRRETLRHPIEAVARKIGAELGWDTPDGPWTQKVLESIQRSKLTALRLSKACGVRP